MHCIKALCCCIICAKNVILDLDISLWARAVSEKTHVHAPHARLLHAQHAKPSPKILKPCSSLDTSNTDTKTSKGKPQKKKT